ncbi:hypothetical protein HAQ01_10820 [Acidithiobacillus thiooxidans]|nr:hypothetical protein [Acidithiobacillus thiooxidans]MBU2793875.1 hypothetical protein [Acidithiobacillus thiooxidans]
MNIDLKRFVLSLSTSGLGADESGFQLWLEATDFSQRWESRLRSPAP